MQHMKYKKVLDSLIFHLITRKICMYIIELELILFLNLK